MSERPKLAFPAVADNGMELRDWFAGQAMQGMALDAFAVHARGFTWEEEANHLADIAYLVADAMMEARKQKL